MSFGDYNGGVKFKLRDFQRGDFETLWKLDQECFPEGIAYTRFELAAYMKRSGSFTVVAEAEMEILGFIVAEANRRGVGHIVTVDVSPATRRFGIASELLRVAENRLQGLMWALTYGILVCLMPILFIAWRVHAGAQRRRSRRTRPVGDALAGRGLTGSAPADALGKLRGKRLDRLETCRRCRGVEQTPHQR